MRNEKQQSPTQEKGFPGQKQGPSVKNLGQRRVRVSENMLGLKQCCPFNISGFLVPFIVSLMFVVQSCKLCRSCFNFCFFGSDGFEFVPFLACVQRFSFFFSVFLLIVHAVGFSFGFHESLGFRFSLANSDPRHGE